MATKGAEGRWKLHQERVMQAVYERTGKAAWEWPEEARKHLDYIRLRKSSWKEAEPMVDRIVAVLEGSDA